MTNTQSPAPASGIDFPAAADGIDSAYRRFVFVDADGSETPLKDWDFDATVETARAQRSALTLAAPALLKRK